MDRNFQHGGQVYNSDGQIDFQLDFSANINPLGLSTAIKTALLENFEGIVHYPDPATTELKNCAVKIFLLKL